MFRDSVVQDKRILDAIKYHTGRISKVFELNGSDKEDIRQELTIAALRAGKSYNRSMNAGSLTYIKSAIGKKAIDIMRAMEKVPHIICCEDKDNLNELQLCYTKNRRDVHEELVSSGFHSKRKTKPVQFNCGGSMQEAVFAPVETEPDWVYDVAIILKKMSAWQRDICTMLMEGKTQSEIAKKLKISRTTIQGEIAKLRDLLRANGYG